MQASVVHTDGREDVRVLTKPLTLEEMQQIVGGYIKIVPCDVAIGDVVANEEGLVYNLPYNEAASAVVGRPLVGPIIFLDYRID